MKFDKQLPLFSTLLLLFFWTAPVTAEDYPAKDDIWSRAGLSLGGYLVALDSEVNFGLRGFQGNINVEEALDLDVSTTVFRVDGFVRFTPNRRHRLDLGWYALRREGRRRLSEDITIGDTTYPAGTTVNSTYNFDIYRLTYSYSFFQDDRMDLAAGVGAYVAPIKFEISSNGGQSTESESFTAPLPVINLRGDFAVTPKLFLRSRIDVFYLELDDYKGGITNLNMALEYRIFKHFSTGIGFETFNFKVQTENSSYPPNDLFGEISYRNVGLTLYLKTHF
jgi:hypothetical protein